ncbi:MAG: hypothetical protein ABS939_20240 [Psychrobacillus sp.]
MFKYFMMLSANLLIGITESGINTMCVASFDEIELPEELEIEGI